MVSERPYLNMHRLRDSQHVLDPGFEQDKARGFGYELCRTRHSQGVYLPSIHSLHLQFSKVHVQQRCHMSKKRNPPCPLLTSCRTHASVGKTRSSAPV